MILKLFSHDPDQTNARVMHVINGEHYSGAERVQDLLALNLPEFGYDVGFACLKSGLFAENRRCQSVPLFQIGMRSKFDLWCYRRLVNFIREFDCQILHAHTPRSLLVASLAARKTGIPLVYHVHSPVGRDSNRPVSNRLNTWLEKWCLQNVSRMICVSNSLRQYMIEQGHPAELLSVIHNGVPVFERTAQLPCGDSPWTIGTVALFRPRKGTEVLIEALKNLRDKSIPVRLLCVGPFETEAYGQSLLSLVEQHKLQSLIEWTGFEKNVSSRLQQMQGLVLPSLFGEGLPMVVLEAMAQGVPVVASDVEGIPEAVRHGVDGLISRAGDAQDLADKIETLIGNREHWQQMSESSWDRQRQNFSDHSMARQLSQIYDEILGNNRSLNAQVGETCDMRV